MSRAGVVGVCAVVLVAGFVAGRASRSGSGGVVTVRDTVEHNVVVSASHLGAAADPADSGPLDIARVSSVRRGADLVTTITAHRRWAATILRRGHVRLDLLYDTNDDGTTDLSDDVFMLRGRLTSWISSFGQGVAAASVVRTSPTTVTVTRDASVFFSRSGKAPLLWTEPIGVAVVATWRGGRDRAPNRGWVTVPAPSAAPTVSTPALSSSPPPAATTTTSVTCADVSAALAKIQRDLASMRRAAALPTKNRLDGNHAINVATDAFLRDISLAPITNIRRNRLIDRAAAVSASVCQQCFQALEAERPIPAIRAGELHCGSS
jgi:hypothetical protein